MPEKRDALSPLLSSCQRDLKESPSGKLLTLVAEEDHHPVGIIVIFYYPLIHSSHVAHFYVLPEKRGQGIGFSLLKKAQEELKALKIRSIEMRFESADQTTASLLKILKHLEWSSPTTVLTRYFFDPLLFTPDWLTHPPQLPAGQTLFPWGELTTNEREQIEQWVRTNPLIEYLSPFEDEALIAKNTSLFLRGNEGVIGWVITHHTTPLTLRYSVYYIHPEHRGSGSAVALLAAAIRLHAAKDPKCQGLAEIQLSNSSSFWKKFVKKRLSPFAVDSNQLFSSHKIDF